MAYPTDSLGQIVRGIDQTAISIKLHCEGRVASATSGNTSSSQIFEDYRRLKQAHDVFAAAETVPGIAAYAKEEKNNQALDVAAEFLAMRSAIAAAMTWIESNFPSSNGYLETSFFSGGLVKDREFSPGATVVYRAALQAVVDAIN